MVDDILFIQVLRIRSLVIKTYRKYSRDISIKRFPRIRKSLHNYRFLKLGWTVE